MNNALESMEGIAVIGLAGRYPGAQDMDQFWQNLRDGVESIQTFTDAEMEETGISPDLYKDPNYIKAGTVLADFDAFDAGFFGFNPREAEFMDPQQRIFLETAWHALENAGYDAEKYPGLIGVYAGASMNNYVLDLVWGKLDTAMVEGYQKMLGNEKDYLSSRVSYKLNLRGPSFTVQTACSTSLVAVHLACQDLLSYQCDMALAGGVCLILPQKRGYLYQEGMIFSPDGHCRAFDANARGTVPGQGAGIVVLKRLSDALADGDRIDAVIKGSAINNDGAMKVGFTAPSVNGQAEVIASAQAISQIDPATITYVEAHGTGTQLGDPIEIAALTQAFRASTLKTGFCAIGSVKTNLGHLDVAAGVTGLIKTVLALKHKQIPPSLHFETPNPEIDFENSPFYVNIELADWNPEGIPRRAGVSSFGIGGTNAHVVLEEAPVIESLSNSRSKQLLVLSAKTPSALDTMTANLAEYFREQADIDLADAAYMLQTGRRDFDHRHAVVCDDRDAAVNALESGDTGKILRADGISANREVVFMFSGQGAQYANMGLELYRTEAAFHDAVDLCADILYPHLEQDLRDILYPKEAADIDAAQQKLTETAITQPALFTVEYALAKQWDRWGIKPDLMVGHSIGEYVAACLAGVFSLEDALALVAARGRLVQGLPTGAMLAVPLPEKDLKDYIGNPLSLAAVNAPSFCVLSGKTEAIEIAEKKLSQQDIGFQRLHTSHAFHSKMMDPILEVFQERFRQIQLKPPRAPYLTNVTGTGVTADQATDPAHWSRHLRRTVRFADCVGELINTPNRVLLEVGPGNTLSTLARMNAEQAPDVPIFSSMRHPKEQTSDVAFILTTLGRLWLEGVQPDWDGFYADQQRQRIPLPSYPFERKRFWQTRSGVVEADTSRPAAVAKPRQSLLDHKNDLADWFFVPSWRQSPIVAPLSVETPTRSGWLVFMDKMGLGAQLAKRLEKDGQDVFKVKIGKKFSRKKDRSYTLNPQNRDDYESLFNDLANVEKLPQTIVHMWSLTDAAFKDSGLSDLDRRQDLGFYSLLNMVQAIGKRGMSDKFKLEVISNNVHDVTGQEYLHPEKATVVGACKVIPLEYANINCRHIDIVFPKSNTRNVNDLIAQLLTEFASQTNEITVAFRGRHRWVPFFESVRMDEAADEWPTRLRDGGVYLVTGGLGGIGFALAEDIAKTVRAKLILTGRSEFPPRNEWEQWLDTHPADDRNSTKIKNLLGIEKLGSEVMVASADIADLNQMQDVVEEAFQQFGHINGVVHAAGVIDEAGAIQRRTRDMTEKGLASKLRGTLVIDETLKDVPLDFMVLCSSVASVLYHNRFGQVSYVAANSFLDAFSAHKTAQSGTFTVTINWDDWEGIGMSARAQKLFVEAFGHHGDLVDPLDHFTPEQGVLVFKRILAGNFPRVVVSTRDLNARVAQDFFISSPFLEAAAAADSTASEFSSVDSLHPAITSKGDIEHALISIWQELLGVENVGAEDSFFDLGGDSLVAVRLFARIESAFGKKYPLAILYESPTIAKLTDLIADKETKSQWSSLVPIQSGNLKPPVFCIHGAGGNVLIYRDLARHLGSDQPVYGLQSQGLDGKQPFLTSIEDMASHYLAEIQAVQPAGPYVLGGYCMGGTVAFEIAQQLIAQGQKVALLFMLETYVWKYLKYETWVDKAIYELEKVSFHWRNFLMLPSREKMTFIQEKFKVAQSRRHVWYGMFAAKMRQMLRMGAQQGTSLFDLWENNDDAAIAYEPEVFPGKITQFRPAKDYSRYDNPDFGWEKHAAGGVEIHKLPVFPAGMIVEPFVHMLAEKLKLSIQRELNKSKNE